MNRVICFIVAVMIACCSALIGLAEPTTKLVIYSFDNQLQIFLEKNFLPNHQNVEFEFQIYPVKDDAYYKQIDKMMNSGRFIPNEIPDVFAVDQKMLDEYEKYKINKDYVYQVTGKRNSWICINMEKNGEEDSERLKLIDKMLRQYSWPVSEGKPILIKSVKVKETKVKIPVGESLTPVLDIKPADATYKVLEWKSSNESICTVDEDGVISAVSAGKCNVEGITADGSKKKVKISVTVFVP